MLIRGCIEESEQDILYVTSVGCGFNVINIEFGNVGCILTVIFDVAAGAGAGAGASPPDCIVGIVINVGLPSTSNGKMLPETGLIITLTSLPFRFFVTIFDVI